MAKLPSNNTVSHNADLVADITETVDVSVNTPGTKAPTPAPGEPQEDPVTRRFRPPVSTGEVVHPPTGTRFIVEHF